jgi:hypothetical protein
MSYNTDEEFEFGVNIDIFLNKKSLKIPKE